MEKYEEELVEIRSSIKRCEENLETLRSREAKLQDQVLLEKFREVNELMEEQEITLEDLKGLLSGEHSSGQIA